ncbi:P-loop containing nucleoside triphosphate hydrolase protein [Aspergillus steynii IBT 23096]|uniref:P-loop containing nucleoside triphosphate hydrolase protein n=1 Tax=Aspergillus steynii IBT 23096 TaxID=1392250 RepID=A0A2I2FV84_9EURO|nr:P-loop containing nucleoside triphosphate hydrolase protein [Aspergillus steynii IBT 23096]PLB44558.1 P-loop containing nucleoside triphosphate hydrolase protein [Aspergillus steynii IBT 23096]
MSLVAKRRADREPVDRPHKARRPSPTQTNSFVPFTIHRALCSAQKDHTDHPRRADYFDAPRLFYGDSRASHLRGEEQIDDLDEYVENHEDISLVWIKFYYCDDYHESARDQFEILRAPLHPMNPMLMRHFSILYADANEAIPEHEEISIVDDKIKDAVEEVIDIKCDRISTAVRTQETSAAVSRLYIHLRHPNVQDDEPEKALDDLLKYMEMAFEKEYQEADDLFARGYVTRRHLAKLFWKDEVIVASRGGQPRAYLCKGWPYWEGDDFVFPSVTWSFDGQFFRGEELVTLEYQFHAEEEVPITDLPVYPLRVADDVKSRLIRRGRAFWRCRSRQFVSYMPSPSAVELPTSNPRYMVDAKTYHHVHSESTPAAGRSYLSKHEHDQEFPPDEEFQILLPATIPAFGFHDKKWISVSVEGIRDIKWNAEAFNHLVLKHTKKELIKALVAKHTAAGDTNDVIEGKGNGLILLLHGGPGTGKTLTAESVAELTERPLYRVTCGDIGTNAEEVERYLESVLYLGTVWQCVVLLDEADVFLEERTQQDLKRNALVSVFLRVLEYYSGILVLTSNRIGTFDEAFKSRVQLTLHYPTLDEVSRRRIWSNFITRLHRTNPEAKADQILERLDELSTFKLNGREIRNSIRTAMLLAEFRGESLQYSHLQDVIDVSNEFEQYLCDTHGHSASESARFQRIRKD